MNLGRWGEVLDDYVEGPALNIGCGKNRLDGWVNVDLYHYADVKFDICQPWPMEPGSVGTIHASHVLEHFRDDDLFTLFWEMGEALRPGGCLLGIVPYGYTTMQMGAPQHKQMFLKETLYNLSSKNFEKTAYCNNMGQGIPLQPWQVEAVWFSVQDQWLGIEKEELEIAARRYLNVYFEMVFVMRMP